MTKSKAKPRSAKKSAKRPNTKPKRAPTRASSLRSSETKHDRVLSMLRSRGGTTIAAIIKVTGWQQHSVRGFLAGVIKKRLGLNLVSQKTSSGRVYRIAGSKSPATNRPLAAPEQPNA